MTLDSKYCGRTLREWSRMTEAQRLADPQVGEKRLKALNARLAEALAVVRPTTTRSVRGRQFSGR
jgi:hypothetical protein